MSWSSIGKISGINFATPTRLYVSRTCFQDSPSAVAAEIVTLLSCARANNLKLEVSGALVFNSRFFGPVLEGRHGAVESLLQKFRLDRRHTDIVLLKSESIKERNFQHWSMAHAGFTSE